MHYLACLLFPLVFALICGFPVCEQDWTLSHTLCVPNPRLCCHTVIVSALVQSILSVRIITAMETLLKGQLFLSCRLYCQDFCLLSFLKILIPPLVLSCLILFSLPSCCVRAFFLASWHCPASHTAVALRPHTCQSFSSLEPSVSLSPGSSSFVYLLCFSSPPSWEESCRRGTCLTSSISLLLYLIDGVVGSAAHRVARYFALGFWRYSPFQLPFGCHYDSPYFCWWPFISPPLLPFLSLWNLVEGSSCCRSPEFLKDMQLISFHQILQVLSFAAGSAFCPLLNPYFMEILFFFQTHKSLVIQIDSFTEFR